jgi:predicted acetyltransferase
VVLHAIEETSAPIYRRFGFEDVCKIVYYRYG